MKNKRGCEKKGREKEGGVRKEWDGSKGSGIVKEKEGVTKGKENNGKGVERDGSQKKMGKEEGVA